MNNAILNNHPTIEFCNHPYEVLRIIRKRKKAGGPLPEVLMIKDPHCKKTLQNMKLKIERLVGKHNCPNLVIIPTR